MRAVFALGIVLAGAACATPLDRRYAVKESHRVPREYTRERDAPGHHLVRLQVALKQSNFAELERHLYETSDPDHHRYGQHLSTAEINELVKPSDASLDLVREWLSEHVDVEGITSSAAGDILTFTVPVSKAESMLQTKYGVYRHLDGSTLIRTPEWKLPSHLHEHVEAIQPTTSFLRGIAQRKGALLVPDSQVAPTAYKQVDDPTVETVCNTGGVTPLCLSTLYETVNYKPQVPGKNQAALCDYDGEVNNRSDAHIYLETYRPEAVAAAYEFQQVSVNGGNLQQTPDNATQLADGVGLEGNLDIQTLLGIAWPTPITCYSTAGEPPFIPDNTDPTVDNEPYLTWLDYILQQDFVPQVISNSYEDNEQTVPPSYAHVVCNKYAELSARGVSVFFGSGDGGVSGVQAPGSCLSNRDNETAFIPLFPSSCPYITSVGATVDFYPEVVAYDPANGFSSGGGFSNYFKQPSYQSSAVASYLDKIGSEFSTLYNKSGRAYPDMAAYGVNFTIVWDGAVVRLDGTSAATPTAAAVFSLLNDALIAAGKPVMGFLNPWLYKKGYQAFVDVTSGSAIGCNTTGFQAEVGWDAASGFGTPRFEKLLQLVGLGQNSWGGHGGGW